MLFWIGHFLSRLYGFLMHRKRVVGRDRLIESGPALLVCNHASFLDPPLLACSFRRPVHCLARKSLFKGLLAWLLPRIRVLPIDRGKSDMAGLRRVLELVAAGERVLLFPEGTRSPDGQLMPAEAGIGFLIAKSGVPVQPLRIFGSFEAYPRHAKFPRPGPITVVAGEPIDFSDLQALPAGRVRYQAYADRVMQAIARLELPQSPSEP
jgi:1-acyl-sn-glycerol-3-phosphate acyltransferase